MDQVPVWLFLLPPLGLFMGIMLIIFRKPLQENAVALEKKIGLPKLMRLDAFSENGGATQLIGVMFIVIAVGQAILLVTQL